MIEETIVWIAGTGWDGVPGTDKRMVEAMPQDQHVLWVDPPIPVRSLKALWALKSGSARVEQVAGNVLRVGVPTLPGVTRFGVRRITSLLLGRAVRQALAQSGRRASAVVVAFPLARFPRGTGGLRVLYVTDDWLDGSPLMGFSRGEVRRVLIDNMGKAHHVVAVSEYLCLGLRSLKRTWGAGQPDPVFDVLPNGCPLPKMAVIHGDRQPVAGLVGQLNERLDLDALEAVQASGVAVTIIGPRADRSPEFKRRLDGLLAADNVQWLGPIAPDDLAHRLVHFGVGLTPYADTSFNRASFPLKTLEYLAAGVPVVSTDMPAARWLNSEHVTISEDAEAFARHVTEVLSQPENESQRQSRRDFAAGHSWVIRAKQFLELLKPSHAEEPVQSKREP